MKRLLLVYPNNFLQGATGTNNRVMQLVSMLKQAGFIIDQFAYADFSTNSSFEEFEIQNRKKLIHRLFLYSTQSKSTEYVSRSNRNIFAIKNKILCKIKNQIKKEYLLDWVPIEAKKYFKEIVQTYQYEVIAVFYIYLAPLLDDVQIKGKKVYFMEDSYFIQQFTLSEKKKKRPTLGRLMDEEIKRLQLFNEIICISNDEKIFYEKITGKYIHFLPHLLTEYGSKTENPVSSKKWDVFFIGAENPFNVEGLRWFLEEVYPYLNTNLKILLAGSSVRQIDTNNNENI